MYKVFVNNKPLTISDKKSIITKSIPFHSEADFYQAIDRMQYEEGVHIYGPKEKEIWKKFKKEFKNIFAAGGVVKNHNNEMLWIYRLGKWDLPKGKMEKNEKKKETALREVEEECGISNLKIIKKLPTTYHMYFDKRHILKITYWYEMQYDGCEQLTPQEEEGITDVQWISMKDLEQPLSNTYENIKNLLQSNP